MVTAEVSAAHRHTPGKAPWDDVMALNYEEIRYDIYEEYEYFEDQEAPPPHPTVDHAASHLNRHPMRTGSRHPDVYLTLFGDILNNANHSLPHQLAYYEEARKTYAIPQIERKNLINCSALLTGDEHELKKAQDVMERRPKVPILEERYLEWCEDCDRFKQERGYVLVSSTEEENYPLAFSIAVYKDVEAVERLLRAIYQPQNLYCVHIDAKSPLLFHKTVYALTNCFHNVFVATRFG